MRKTGRTTRIPNELDLKIKEISKIKQIKWSDAGRELVKEYDTLKYKNKIFRRINF